MSRPVARMEIELVDQVAINERTTLYNDVLLIRAPSSIGTGLITEAVALANHSSVATFAGCRPIFLPGTMRPCSPAHPGLRRFPPFCAGSPIPLR